MTHTLSFKPKQVTKRLLSALPTRAREVIIKRYGLGKDTEKMTLEGIGETYNITRERVRQIENAGLANIRKSSYFKQEKATFDELEKVIRTMGGIIAEEDLLKSFSKDKSTQNHIHFILVIGDAFKKEKEDDEFKHRWNVDPELAKKVHESLRKLYKGLSEDDIIPESELIASFLEHIKDVNEQYKNEEIIKRWLALSKNIDKNPLGEWGRADSPNIHTKGIRDYAFLAMRKHGSPIHFKEIAKIISDIFGKKAHVATTHNELIKDDRFVLVGRGLYALSEWGYLSGVVKDVIKKVLEKHGPLKREEIIDKVLKERYVKENTIMVNLQNPKVFKKDKEGRYTLV
ncbi:MAG: sigma factor-like helix-turn-helix DNA-binding protein [Candidatus Pacebacteria bacterium]|nr:sigma factor-like helix-turn-helix DNA-binding protein [Candidatus Paceibacterota bacterium]